MLLGLRKRRLRRHFGELLGRDLDAILCASAASEPDAEPASELEVLAADGPEVYRLDDDEAWSVRDDHLAERLGLRSNHAAEDKVQRDLKKRDPALLSRLEFDSEADTFFAYAETEEDAMSLRTFLTNMT